jgi:GNAT superfamily N-acetyltransferase
MTAANDNALPFESVLREMVADDRNYVLSSWLRSYAEGPEFRSLARPVYFALYEPVVQQLIDRSFVYVACLSDARDVILGWAAVDKDALHYVLVKPRWRGHGIMHKLLSDTGDLPMTFTHVPPSRLARLIPPTWKYDPMRRFERKAA